METMNKLLDIELSQDLAWEKSKQWEMLKLTTRGSTIQFAARKQKSNKQNIEVLEKKLKQLQIEQLELSDILKNTEEQIWLIKHELQDLISVKTKGAIIRSWATWASQAEIPTRYFLNLEKKRAQSKTLHRLVMDEGQILQEGKAVLEEIRSFYEKLYTSKGGIDEEFLQNLDVPQLSEDIKNELDKPITTEELGKALKLMNNNKSPSVDGLPCEWYKMFWGKIKFLFTDLAHEYVNKGTMHLTARTGLISLLEKPEKNLNCYVLAMRMQKVQPILIHPQQTGFVKGRHLSTNIIKLMEIMTYCEQNKIDGLIVSFDF